ncbi:MAG: ABC transporter ATP-binding protein [Deinococcus sp.]|nr:ABC transporter ATP-binding protein [Deinococcus sp.]
MILRLENLGFSYPEAELFQGVNLELDRGDAFAVLGPSGSGKTTLIHLVAGLLRLQTGEVFWEERPIRDMPEERLASERLRFLGLVFQHHYLFAELTALENVMVSGYLAGKVERKWAEELVARVGLEAKGMLMPKALSGGERQRVALARALYPRPKLLVADEPTGSLDRKNAERVMSLMLELTRELGNALLLATHDEHLAAGLQILRLGA